MFNLGMGEITVVLVLALIFIGPKKLPELASGLGKLIREIRKTTADVKNEIQLDEAIRKPFEELREAVTLHPEELKRRDRIRRDLEAAQRSAAEISAKMEAAQTNGVTAPATDAAAPAALGTETTVPVTAATSDVPVPPTAAPIGTIARPPVAARLSAPAVPVTSAPPGYVPPPPPSLTSPVPPIPPTASRPSVQEDLGDMLRRLSEVHHRNTGRMAAVPTAAPLTDSAADRSNTTQSLSEADLAAIAVGPTGSPPPPPPRATRSGRIVVPPMPGLTEAAPKPAAAAEEEKKPDPAT